MSTFKGYPTAASPVVIWFDVKDEIAHAQALRAIEEAQEYQFGNRWTARFDKGLQPNQQDHLHVMFKGRDACIINKDGTPSHKSLPSNTLPIHVRQAIQKIGKVRIEEAAFLGEDISSWSVPRSVMVLFRMRMLGRQ